MCFQMMIRVDVLCAATKLRTQGGASSLITRSHRSPITHGLRRYISTLLVKSSQGCGTRGLRGCSEPF